MNVSQRNKVAMFKAINKVFKDYPTELSAIAALGNLMTDFTAVTKQIEEAHQVQLGLSTSNSQLKIKEEAEMIEATVEMAAALFVYAQMSDLPQLKAKCDVSPSSLEKMSDEKLYATCLNIYNLAANENGNLTDYGKSPEDLVSLKKEIDDFSAIISSPRSAIVTRSQATAELDRLIREANDMLNNKVDKLMLMLKSNTKVYNTYKAARVIVDLRRGKTFVDEE